AEDGIRDFHVTGVQTCALPIWPVPHRRQGKPGQDGEANGGKTGREIGMTRDPASLQGLATPPRRRLAQPVEHDGERDDGKTRLRSEERRVGKECISRWWPDEGQ